MPPAPAAPAPRTALTVLLRAPPPPPPFRTDRTRLVRCRVQEATLQEERLITTGNFKDLQRNNVKMVLPAARRLPPAARAGSGPARGSRCTIYGWLSTDDA